MSSAADLAARAAALDAADAFAGLRTRFALPRNAAGDELAYLCGHSLGLAPRAARARVLEELDDWERLGVLGHEEARRHWSVQYPAQTSDEILVRRFPAQTFFI